MTKSLFAMSFALFTVAMIGFLPKQSKAVSCLSIEEDEAPTFQLRNTCDGNGWVLIYAGNPVGAPSCMLVRLRHRQDLEFRSWRGVEPRVVDACGDTPSCKRELEEKLAQCN